MYDAPDDTIFRYQSIKMEDNSILCYNILGLLGESNYNN